MEPTETVPCSSVNSVPQTLTVQRVLDCAQLVLKDLLQVQIEQNAVCICFEIVHSVIIVIFDARNVIKRDIRYNTIFTTLSWSDSSMF